MLVDDINIKDQVIKDKFMDNLSFKQIAEQIEKDDRFAAFSRFDDGLYAGDFDIIGIALRDTKDPTQNYKPVGIHVEIVGHNEIAPRSDYGILFIVLSNLDKPYFFELGSPSAESQELQINIAQTTRSDYSPLIETKVIKSLRGLTAVEMKVIVDQIQCLIDEITHGAYVHPKIIREQLQNSPKLRALLRVDES